MNPTETQKTIFRFFFYNQTEIADLGYLMTVQSVEYPGASGPGYDITNETPGIKEFTKRFNELEQERQKTFDEIRNIFPNNNLPESLKEYGGSYDPTALFDPSKDDSTNTLNKMSELNSMVKKYCTSKEDMAYAILGIYFGNLNTAVIWSNNNVVTYGQEKKPTIAGTAQVISETSPYIQEDLSEILKKIAEFDTQEVTSSVAKKLEEALKKTGDIMGV